MTTFLKPSGIKGKFSQQESASLWSPIFYELWPSFTNPILKKKEEQKVPLWTVMASCKNSIQAFDACHKQLTTALLLHIVKIMNILQRPGELH